MPRSGYRSLGYLLHRIYVVLRIEVTEALEPIGLSLAQYVLLVMLADTPGQSSAELARAIGLTPQAANLVLKELEDLGLVRRPPLAPSGRARPAKLTSAGAARLKRAENIVRRADENLLKQLTKQGRDEFRRLLGQLGSAHPESN